MICELCNTQEATERHHVMFGVANRKLSEKHKLVAWLCADCHRNAPWAVHNHRASDLKLKVRYQMKFEQIHTRGEWMAIFGRNYLD